MTSSMSVFLTEGNVEIYLSRLHATWNPEERDKLLRLLVREESQMGSSREHLENGERRVSEGRDRVVSQRGLVADIPLPERTEALSTLLHALPADLPAAVLVTLHRPVEREGQLQQILRRVSRLPLVVAGQGERPLPGKCYLGIPSRHLTVGPAIEFDGPVDRVAPIGELAHEICRLVHSNAHGHVSPLPSEPANP